MKEINILLKDIGLSSKKKEELKEYIENRYMIIIRNKKLLESFQLKKDLFKEFREELIPIANFSFSSYAISDAKYKVVIGNQKYDGIEEANGYGKKIEFTSYFDEKEENHLMRSMIKTGVGSVQR